MTQLGRNSMPQAPSMLSRSRATDVLVMVICEQTKIPTSRLIILNYSLFKEKELAWKRHKQKIVNTEIT